MTLDRSENIAEPDDGSLTPEEWAEFQAMLAGPPRVIPGLAALLRKHRATPRAGEAKPAERKESAWQIRQRVLTDKPAPNTRGSQLLRDGEACPKCGAGPAEPCDRGVDHSGPEKAAEPDAVPQCPTCGFVSYHGEVCPRCKPAAAKAAFAVGDKVKRGGSFPVGVVTRVVDNVDSFNF